MDKALPEPIRLAAEALAKKAKMEGTDGWIYCVGTVGLMLASLGAPTEGMVDAGSRAINRARTAAPVDATAGREAVTAAWAAMVEHLVGHALQLHELGTEDWSAMYHDDLQR